MLDRTELKGAEGTLENSTPDPIASYHSASISRPPELAEGSGYCPTTAPIDIPNHPTSHTPASSELLRASKALHRTGRSRSNATSGESTGVQRRNPQMPRKMRSAAKDQLAGHTRYGATTACAFCRERKIACSARAVAGATKTKRSKTRVMTIHLPTGEVVTRLLRENKCRLVGYLQIPSVPDDRTGICLPASAESSV